MYFEGGVSSVYLWDTEEAGQGREMAFAGVVLLKKSKILFQCIS
jgi:capping protein beta